MSEIQSSPLPKTAPAVVPVPETGRALAEEYAAGSTLHELSRRYGMSYGTVLRKLAELQVERRGRGYRGVAFVRLNEARDAEMVRLAAAGATQGELAGRYGISKVRVGQIVRGRANGKVISDRSSVIGGGAAVAAHFSQVTDHLGNARRDP